MGIDGLSFWEKIEKPRLSFWLFPQWISFLRKCQFMFDHCGLLLYVKCQPKWRANFLRKFFRPRRSSNLTFDVLLSPEALKWLSKVDFRNPGPLGSNFYYSIRISAASKLYTGFATQALATSKRLLFFRPTPRQRYCLMWLVKSSKETTGTNSSFLSESGSSSCSIHGKSYVCMVCQISKTVLILPSFSWFGEIKKAIEHFLNFFHKIIISSG